MSIKSLLSRLLALMLVVVIGLVGCSSSPTGLGGNYTQDTLKLIDTLSAVIELPKEAENKAEIQSQARDEINDYISRYRRDQNSGGLRSFTTMQTALNAIAGYYTSYGTRPLPEKLKNRLKQEFKQVQFALEKGI
ncbi:photosystem II protein Psb27 [Gloeothece verrucosa]|uniref:Photosystem II lipoprotein Psb27 n=1 Tax=Gloeothece verrucosa (strain PCC 7822) TaxID=497965 RepID=E0UBL2_GLOV7|nr:photosystem II protein Psb27 [Gloeothece verrucosa]ADN13956.1 photosystem II protein Psb27 [Gloeothece verrucosa PCC 7822]